MNLLDTIFSYYDQLLSPIPVYYQALISLGVLIFLIWNVYSFIKSGHWLFLAILVATLPGTWPAAKKIGLIVWYLLKGLLIRIQGL
jgi:hypothetical protein